MTKVRALKTREDAEKVGFLLEKHYGRKFELIWRFALNVGLRMGDVLSITMMQAKRSLKTGVIEIKESKTQKYNSFEVNVGAKEIIRERLEEFSGDAWLFQSHSRNAEHLNKPITRQSIYKALKDVGDNMIHIKLGTHSARKTRARIMHEQGTPIEKICTVLNHSNVKETMRYLDITQDEKNKTYHELVF